jgi:hypothetical protein
VLAITTILIAVAGVIIGIFTSIYSELGFGLLIIFVSILAGLVIFMIFRDKQKRAKNENRKITESFNASQEINSKYEELDINQKLPEPFEYQEKYRTVIDFCMICKLEIRDKQMIMFCPFCKSYFHEDHLNEWLNKNSDCPVCNKPLKNG